MHRTVEAAAQTGPRKNRRNYSSHERNGKMVNNRKNMSQIKYFINYKILFIIYLFYDEYVCVFSFV